MSLFGWRRAQDDRRVLAIKLELRSGAKSLPEPMVGAIVTAFSFAEDPGVAAAKCVHAAQAKGVEVSQVFPNGFSIPVHKWRAYVEGEWPEFAEQMPAQSEIAGLLSAGAVVFGPLIGFEHD